LLFAQAGLDCDLPTVSGKTGMYHHAQHLSMTYGLINFLAQASGTAILLMPASHIAWDDKCTPTCPPISWDEILLTFYLGWDQTAILLNSTSQVATITGMNYQIPTCWIFLIRYNPICQFLLSFLELLESYSKNSYKCLHL
jgi:hypothetical protein